MTQVFDPVTLRHVEQDTKGLKDEFRGIFSEETVDRFVRESLEPWPARGRLNSCPSS